MGAILTTKNLTKQFGPLVAVNGVTLSFEEGKVSGVIGPNGSGKTTLFNLLSGYFPPTQGKIFYEGKDITALNPQQRVNIGIGRSFQLVSVFPKLKVYENMVLSVLRFHENKRKGFPFYFVRVTKSEEVLEDCRRLLEMVNLQKKLEHMVGELSYGDQRLLEIILSISLKPKILLLDEPFSGLGDVEIAIILELLEKVKNDFTIAIIEHKISKIENMVDDLFVLSEGALVCEGSPKDVLCDPIVKKCYWGEGD